MRIYCHQLSLLKSENIQSPIIQARPCFAFVVVPSLVNVSTLFSQGTYYWCRHVNGSTLFFLSSSRLCFCLGGCEVDASSAHRWPYKLATQLSSFLTRLLCSFTTWFAYTSQLCWPHCLLLLFAGIDSLNLSRPTSWPVTQPLLFPR